MTVSIPIRYRSAIPLKVRFSLAFLAGMVATFFLMAAKGGVGGMGTFAILMMPVGCAVNSAIAVAICTAAGLLLRAPALGRLWFGNLAGAVGSIAVGVLLLVIGILTRHPVGHYYALGLAAAPGYLLWVFGLLHLPYFQQSP